LKIKGVLEHWPALHERPSRSVEYLMERTMGRRRLLPVELRRSYTDEGWGQRIVRFGEFLEDFILLADDGRRGAKGKEGVNGKAANGHEHSDHGEGGKEGKDERNGMGYLAQH